MIRTAEQQADMDLGYVAYKAIVHDVALYGPWHAAKMDDHPLKESFMVAAAKAVKRHLEKPSPEIGPGSVLDAAQLDALPDHSVVSDRDDDIFQKRGDGADARWCAYECAALTTKQLSRYRPVMLVRYGKGGKR